MAQKKITFIEISKIANYYKTTESEYQGKKGIFYFLMKVLFVLCLGQLVFADSS